MRPSKQSRLELGEIRGKKPRAMWIPLTKIKIDISYQREQSRIKINAIARDWDWDLAGTADMVLRDDGYYYAADGGTRAAAASLRPDIEEIFCLVHEFDSVEKEADFFYRKSKTPTIINSIDQHRAMLCARYENAVKIQKFVDQNGLVVSKGGDRSHSIRCMASVHRAMGISEEACGEAIRISTEISDGLPVDKDLFGGVFYLLRNLPEALSQKQVDKLKVDIGLVRIRREIKGMVADYGGGDRSAARGLLACLNLKRKNKFRFPEGEEVG